ncbi:MAG: glycine zipper 2TM domain-containing protein [Verrucomicrobiae bacterium]|nr:glycine zipper 2TM domain-containing protein [Verrucomicrobiae bacterium]NNJ42404.1 glycine zipper 2TM domain-containing protein [Akkermansiaceae bacterium]
MKASLKSTLVLITACPILLVSCAQTTNTSDTYSRSEASHAQSVRTGKITSVRRVNIEGGSQAGTLIGALAGGALGSNIGSGRTSNTLGALGGAAVGSIAGSHIQQKTGARAGLEITVKLDRGGSLSVVQEYNPREAFRVGERVRVLSNRNKTRVTH